MHTGSTADLANSQQNRAGTFQVQPNKCNAMNNFSEETRLRCKGRHSLSVGLLLGFSVILAFITRTEILFCSLCTPTENRELLEGNWTFSSELFY